MSRTHIQIYVCECTTRNLKRVCVRQSLTTQSCINARCGCDAGAAGEALEAELNKAGPGSCRFVTCDVSKEDDIKVKVSPRLLRSLCRACHFLCLLLTGLSPRCVLRG